MILSIQKIIEFQKKSQVKCLHNELRIIYEISVSGPLESMEILKRTGRSISGHNEDIKRLLQIGALRLTNISTDKRKRIYELTELIKNLFYSVSWNLARRAPCRYCAAVFEGSDHPRPSVGPSSAFNAALAMFFGSHPVHSRSS